jgi:hypothetical protein
MKINNLKLKSKLKNKKHIKKKILDISYNNDHLS